MDTKVLKFSEVEYDTTKAKKLFTEHSQFCGINIQNTTEFVEDSASNKICLSKYFTIGCIKKDTDLPKKLWRLSELVEENAELFCQLEYTIRKIQPEELKAFDLKLIVQNLMYCASRKKDDPLTRCIRKINMCDDSPLVNLALAAQQVLSIGYICIHSEKQTAVVSWLFADLCRKAGFEENQVYLRFDKTCPTEYQTIKEFENGCLAVVTAKSDLDSAVDVLVETPDRYPWRVKRILVQESVLRRFRVILGDKARRKSGAKVDNVLLRQCTSGYRYEKKTFLFDFVGEAQHNEQFGIILVEAYQTVKELLTLLNNFKPYALSVWSDSVAESNEISHNAPSNIIWINSFGNFDGPPQASQSFFSIVEHIFCRELLHIVEPRNLLEVWKCWSALDISERALKLKDFEQCNMTAVYDGFYYVSNKYVCVGTEKPIHVVRIRPNTNISDILSYLVKGGCIILNQNCMCPKQYLVDKLRSVDAPVGWTNVTYRKGSNCVEATSRFMYGTKVVWTSYGTIFSN